MAFTTSLLRAGSAATFRRRKKRLENWTDRDTFILIDVWRENHMALRCVKRNHHIYQKMAQQLLQRSAVARSTFEVKNKICNLTSLYRREKVRTEREDDSPNWKYWDAVHDVMCAVGTPYLDPSIVDGSVTSVDDAADSNMTFHPQVEAILSTPTKSEMECRAAGSDPTYAADAINALLTANEIKQEACMQDVLTENHEDGHWENHVGRLSAQVEERPPLPLPSPKKRKYRLEDQLRLIYEETRRMNTASRRADSEALALMREQLDLQRRSLEIEERIAGAIERACLDISTSARSISGQPVTVTLPAVRRSTVGECNGNPSASSTLTALVNGTAASASSAFAMDDS